MAITHTDTHHIMAADLCGMAVVSVCSLSLLFVQSGMYDVYL